MSETKDSIFDKEMTSEEFIKAVMDTEAFEADEVDDLEKVPFATEKDVDERFTVERLAADRVERAQYGLSRRDLWDAQHVIVRTLARGLIILRDNDAEDSDIYHRRDTFINDLIAYNESFNTNTMAAYRDNAKHQAELARWKAEWNPRYETFRQNIVENWKSISDDGAAFVWNEGQARQHMKALRASTSHADTYGVIEDPITFSVAPHQRDEHFFQRSMRGFSDWDLKEFRSFIVWLLSQAMVFHASDDAHSWPGREPWEKFEEWREFLLNNIEKLLIGESYMRRDRTILLSNQGAATADYYKVIQALPDFLTHLWD